jgi:hypothetical protein
MSGDTIMIICFLGLVISFFVIFLTAWCELPGWIFVPSGAILLVCLVGGFIGQAKNDAAFNKACHELGGVALHAKHMDKCVGGIDLTNKIR